MSEYERFCADYLAHRPTGQRAMMQDIRTDLSESTVGLNTAALEAEQEGYRGRRKHGVMHSPEEMWGVLHGEVKELEAELFTRPRDMERVHAEAIQVAAVALRIAESARTSIG